MRMLFAFMFSIFSSAVLMGQTTPSVPTPPPATAKPEISQQKLERFWKAYEQSYGVSIYTIKGFRKKAVTEANAYKLDDPIVQEKAVAALGKAWSKRISETFTEPEIDYLIQLYSNPIAKKMYLAEQNFWGIGLAPIIKSVINQAALPASGKPTLVPQQPPVKK